MCFDTGGLDIKPDTGMLNMKKDMGGAATALGARAHDHGAQAESAAARDHPGGGEFDLRHQLPPARHLHSRARASRVEIGNTDAEGRLVLADALALADEDKPALIVDFATLTGAARVALGPDVPPFFTDDDALAAELARCAAAENDPLWRMPLWRPYEPMLDSKVADTQQCQHRRPGRRHHRRAVPAPLRGREILAASRHLRLDAGGQARPAGRRRMPGGARALCAAARARYVLNTMVALDPRINPFRPELAAKHLQGQVEAARFVEGARHEVIEPIAGCAARRRTRRRSTPRR